MPRLAKNVARDDDIGNDNQDRSLPRCWEGKTQGNRLAWLGTSTWYPGRRPKGKSKSEALAAIAAFRPPWEATQVGRRALTLPRGGAGGIPSDFGPATLLSLIRPVTLPSSSNTFTPARDAMGGCNHAGIQDVTPLSSSQTTRARKGKEEPQRKS